MAEDQILPYFRNAENLKEQNGKTDKKSSAGKSGHGFPFSFFKKRGEIGKQTDARKE